MTTVTELKNEPVAAAIMIGLSRIELSPTNPRRKIDPQDLAELTESIRKIGVLQPIVVRPHPKGLQHGYELVAGERRYRAATEAGHTSIPASVRDLTDDDVLEIQVVENCQRSDVHPLDEAAAFRRLLATERYSVARIAERIGKSVPYVYDRIRLLDLVPLAQEIFLDGKISAGHAIILARLKPADQTRALNPQDHALFQDEQILWDPNEKKSDEVPRPWDGLKTRTARELQAWVDKHVRFNTSAEDLPELFPETASTLAVAREEAEKIVSITHESYVQPEARDGGRIISPRSWKLADPSRGGKLCDHAVTGVVAVGPDRGAAFKVCLEKKKCPTHWGREMREATKTANAGAAGGHDAKLKAQQEAERKRQEKEVAERKAFDKARPEILKALADRVLATAATSPGPLASILEVGRMPNRELAMVPAGKSAESIVRHMAWNDILHNVNWWRVPELTKHAKTLGVDIAGVMKKHLPAPEKPQQEKKAAKTTGGKPKPEKATKAGAPKRGA